MEDDFIEREREKIEQELLKIESLSAEEKLEVIGIRDIFRKNKNEGTEAILKWLLKNDRFATMPAGDVYIYLKGIYTQGIAERIIKNKVKLILQEDYKERIFLEVLDKLKIETDDLLPSQENFEEKDKNLLCVANGILNIRTGEFSPHSPDKRFLAKISASYNPEADCPVIKRFFSDVFYQEDIPLIEEWIGFCLHRDYLFKKALILTGCKNTGKSTFINLLASFIGRENASNEDLYRLNGNRFSTINLYGKMLNIYDDLDFKDLADVGTFKMLVGQSLMRGERKFKDSFSFYNYAKLTFTCNRIPTLKSKDFQDDAYFDRWLVVAMDNFVEEANRDPELKNRLTSERELSGLLNLALSGLARLFKNNGFSNAKSWEENKKLMDRSGSPLASYVQDRLVQVEGNCISKEDLFQDYQKYAVENHFPVISKDKIGKNLLRFAPHIKDGEKLITLENGRKTTIRVWANVAFRGNEESIPKVETKEERVGLGENINF